MRADVFKKTMTTRVAHTNSSADTRVDITEEDADVFRNDISPSHRQPSCSSPLELQHREQDPK